MARHTASREPKFHQAEILDGAGRSIRELLIIFNRGCDFRMLGAIILFLGEKDCYEDCKGK